MGARCQCARVSFQMQRCTSLLFVSFVFCAALSETVGLVLTVSTEAEPGPTSCLEPAVTFAFAME